MNNHIAFAKGKKNVVLVQQEGYEDKEYTLDELNVLYNALCSKPDVDQERLDVIDAALLMMLNYGTVDEEDVEETTEEVAEYDA